VNICLFFCRNLTNNSSTEFMAYLKSEVVDSGVLAYIKHVKWGEIIKAMHVMLNINVLQPAAASFVAGKTPQF
jgi:hypothetical protein